MTPVPARLIAASLGVALLGVVDASAACRQDTFESVRYAVCSVDPASEAGAIQVFWRDGVGAPYRTFGALTNDLSTRGVELVFAMNGGMFATDYSPIGLHIENGEQLAAANTKDAPAGVRPVPNFYKKPNGIFWVDENGGAGVSETGRFLSERPPATFATQSGPLLVIDNAIHPAFIVGSRDRKRRNGVGVCAGGSVNFVISEGVVNFHDFARYFRDRLGCPNALFLDGGWAPGLYAPELKRHDWPGHGGFGPIVGLVRAMD